MGSSEWVDVDATAHNASQEERRSPFLVALGERVRTLRSRQGMTRRAVAVAAQVSERHLANLEYGTGATLVLAGEHDDRVTLLDLCSAHYSTSGARLTIFM